jgi:integrase
LEKPLSLYFPTEAAGIEYCRKLEALLDRGIVPTEHQVQQRILNLEQMIRQYLREGHPSAKDASVLPSVAKAVGEAVVTSLDANWVDGWITRMKREQGLAPNTIHSKLGALARCCDWGMRKKLLVLPDHPFRTLPVGYARYTKEDAAFQEPREDESRDRRLEPGEEAKIRKAIAAWVPKKAYKWLNVPDRAELERLFDLALETAMRLREMYTLTPDQIDLKGRTVFLSKTKNGDSRVVPLTTVATNVLKVQLETLAEGAAHIFPWYAQHAYNLKMTSNFISKLYADVFEQAGCGDLRLHDLRHEAVSRLFERTQLTTEEVMKITGHKTHKMMMRYLKLRPSTLVSKLW